MLAYLTFLEDPVFYDTYNNMTSGDSATTKRGRDGKEKVGMGEGKTADGSGGDPKRVTPQKKANDGTSTMDVDHDAQGTEEDVQMTDEPKEKTDGESEANKGKEQSENGNKAKMTGNSMYDKMMAGKNSPKQATKSAPTNKGSSKQTTQTSLNPSNVSGGTKKYNFSLWCYTQVTLSGTRVPAKEWREKTQELWTELLKQKEIVAIPARPTKKGKPITGSSLYPQDHSGMKTYVASPNTVEDFTKPIKDSGHRDFTMIFQIGMTKKLKEEDLIDTAISLSERRFQFEIKRYQAEWSEKGMLCVNIPSHMPEDYLQTKLQAIVIKAVRESKSAAGNIAKSNLEQDIKAGKFNILVTRSYPANWYQRQKEGEPRIGTEHKRYPTLEYNVEVKQDIIDAFSTLKV